MGPQSVLTKAEETMLASFCIQYLKCGFPINRNDLCDIVQNVVQEDGHKTPFTNGRPGHALLVHGFMRRNPLITERLAETLTGASVTEGAIRKWFSDIHTYVVDEEHAENVFLTLMSLISFWPERKGMSWDQ